MEKIQVEMVPHPRPDKAETQNTLRFVEEAEGGLPPVLGGLYIQKWKMNGSRPRRLRVTVEEIS